MRYVFALTAVLFWAAPASAEGGASCLPKYTALQTFEEPTAQTFVRPLISHNSTGEFITRVRMEGELREDQQVHLRVRFDPNFDGVSLPYNLFAVLVLANGQVLAWYDFTQSCTGPGIGFFPGRTIELPTIKWPGHSSQKLQIMVWGRL